MFKFNLEPVTEYSPMHEVVRRGYSYGEHFRLDKLGTLTLLALSSGDDGKLEELADLLVAVCPTLDNLHDIIDNISELEYQLWKRI